ncbi:MAG: N-formylglutamate amidohydrolase [Gammaproteobacteria bacterium]
MTLPLLLSVPHAGLEVPDCVKSNCLLDAQAIADDGDGGAREIYSPLDKEVFAFIMADVARAFVDLNREPTDFRKDGVIKTHTCWDIPIYADPLSENIKKRLIEEHYRAYHARLSQLLNLPVRLGIDCHTMAAEAPPVAPDVGAVRPMVNLGNCNGASCDSEITSIALSCLRTSFAGFEVTLNVPFSGGYITRTYGRNLPFLQLELSRSGALSNSEKTARVRSALTEICNHCQWHID